MKRALLVIAVVVGAAATWWATSTDAPLAPPLSAPPRAQVPPRARADAAEKTPPPPSTAATPAPPEPDAGPRQVRRNLITLGEGGQDPERDPFLRLCAEAIRSCTFNRQVWLPSWLNLRLARQQGTFRATVTGLADAPVRAKLRDDMPVAMRALLEEQARRHFTVDRAPEWLGRCVVDALRGKSFAWTGGDDAKCRVENGALAQVDDAALASQVRACLGPTSTVHKLTVTFSQVVSGDEVHVEGVALTSDGQPELATEACVRRVFQLAPVRFTDRPPFETLEVTLELQTSAPRPPLAATELKQGGPHTPRTPLDDQVDAAEACVRARPNDASCHLALGKAMSSRAARDSVASDRDKAVAAYRRFVELAPDHPLAPKVRDLLEAAGFKP